MADVPSLALRTAAFYILLVVAMRWTGKRTVTAMAPFDLVFVIIIGEVAAIPIANLEVDMLHGLLPVLLLAGLHVLLTSLNLKLKPLEAFTEGRPALLVHRGRVLRENLLRERVSLEDLASALRLHQVTRLEDVEEAWLEPAGGVSVILRPEARPLTRQDLHPEAVLERLLRPPATPDPPAPPAASRPHPPPQEPPGPPPNGYS